MVFTLVFYRSSQNRRCWSIIDRFEQKETERSVGEWATNSIKFCSKIVYLTWTCRPSNICSLHRYIWSKVDVFFCYILYEQRDSVEKLLDFESAALSRHLHCEGKKAANSKLRSFSTDSGLSYIHYALVLIEVFIICVLVPWELERLDRFSTLQVYYSAQLHKILYRSRQYHESIVLNITEVSWFSRARGSLKTDHFEKKISKNIQ